MNNRTNETLSEDLSTENIVHEPTDEGCELAEELIAAFAGALDNKEMKAFDIMQGLVQFFVSTVKTLEIVEGSPDNFREILMRNIELNFDYKDGKDAGIDLSDLLLEGVIEDYLKNKDS